MPYRISEAVGLGPGIMARFEPQGSLESVEQSVYASVIVLGGSKSDYYNVIDRDYNMGSGYSMKTRTRVLFRRAGFFALNFDYYRIFTWKGIENIDTSDREPLYYNVQGDKSNAELVVLNPVFFLTSLAIVAWRLPPTIIFATPAMSTMTTCVPTPSTLRWG